MTDADVCPQATSGGETLNFVDFVAAICAYALFDEESLCKYCFYIFDVDKSGCITSTELKDLLSVVNKLENVNANTHQTVDKLMDLLDSDGNGVIEFSGQHNARLHPNQLFTLSTPVQNFAT